MKKNSGLCESVLIYELENTPSYQVKFNFWLTAWGFVKKCLRIYIVSICIIPMHKVIYKKSWQFCMVTIAKYEVDGI